MYVISSLCAVLCILHTQGTYHIHHLYHSAPLIVNYVFTVLKRTPQSQGYMDIPWLQRHCLVYIRFVHCGGTFQTPTHYGTKRVILIELGIYIAADNIYLELHLGDRVVCLMLLGKLIIMTPFLEHHFSQCTLTSSQRDLSLQYSRLLPVLRSCRFNSVRNGKV